jgi:CHAT domain-containing protein
MIQQVESAVSITGSRRNPSRNHSVWLALALLASGHLIGAGMVAPFRGVEASRTPGSTQQYPGDTCQLIAGSDLERELSSGQLHQYQIELSAGQFLHLEINKEDTQLFILVFDPGGEPVMQFENRRDGPTPIFVVAQTAGAYRFEVRSLEEDARSYRYQISVKQVQQATALSRNRVAAFKSFANAERLRGEWSKDSLNKAIKAYQEALLNWQVAGQRRLAACALQSIGDLHCVLSENQKALRYYNQALLLYKTVKDWRGEIDTLNDIGYSYIDLGDIPKTMNYCNRAHRLSQQVGYARGEARALTNIGLAYDVSGDPQKAIDFLNQAVAIWQRLKDRSGQAEALMNLGYTRYDLGEVHQALDCYQQALVFWAAAKKRQGQARTLTAIGGAFSFLGEKQQALNFHKQAVELFETMGDRNGQAAALNGIGYVYEDLGENSQALDFYSRALEIYRALSNRRYEALTIGYVGKIHALSGEQGQAFKYYNRKLALSRILRDRRMEAYVLEDMGAVFEFTGNQQKALDHYNRALALSQMLGDLRAQAYTLNDIGFIYESRVQRRRALQLYNEAFDLIQSVQDRRGETQTIYNIARVERDLGHLAAACNHIKSALALAESLRTKIVNTELRASYFASVHQHYELYIDLLMQMHKQHPSEQLNVAALEASERARARELLEILTEARADIRKGVDAGLLQRKRDMQQQINVRAEQQVRLLNEKPSEAQKNAIKKELETLLTQYQEVETQIRLQSPRYAALTQPALLNLGEIQQLLDSDTLLLEYSLGDARSYLWAVSATSMMSYELPGSAEIKAAASPLLEAFFNRQPTGSQSARFTELPGERFTAQYWQQASRLSRMLLGPVAPQLESRRLVIVAEGVLQYIPFSALPVPQQMEKSGHAVGYDAAGLTPLVVEHEIVNLPSASALAVLRREANDKKPATRAIAVLADPVFEMDDSRVPGAVEASAATHPPLAEKAHRRRDERGFPRLFSTEEEAEAILAFAPPGQCFKATGFQASRETATNGQLSQYRIVHFATHELLDTDHPELSAIVLSLVDERGQPQDGFLRLHDIYNLELAAELVVLSACNTALGKEIKGEGLIGMTRGFMYAGARRVVASLWKVDDDATAELMKLFYEGMLKKNLRPAAALQSAQVEMWKQKRWRAPSYWAAFILQGEWK